MDPNKRDVFVIWKQYIIELAFLAAEEKVFGGGKKPNKNFVEYYNEQLAKTIESTFEARLRRLLFDLDDLNDDFQGLFQTAVDQALHEFDFKKLTQWHCCTHNPVVTTKIREKLEEHLKKLEQILKHKTRPKNPKIRCSKWRWFPKSQRSRYESLGP